MHPMYFMKQQPPVRRRKIPGAMILTLALLCLLCSCGPTKAGYIRQVRGGLDDFAACADAFTDSLQQIADVHTVPTTEQCDDIETKLNALSKVCLRLEQLDAPKSCAKQQQALSRAMETYRDALERCRVLLSDYRDFDATIRSYPTPDEGSAAMRQTINEHYTLFIETLRQAQEYLRQAEILFAL